MTDQAKYTVLSVDANSDESARVERYLEPAAFRVRPARGAVDGLKRLDDGSVDCVVCSVALPEMDVGKFIELARDDNPNLQFVVVTDASATDGTSVGATVTDEERVTTAQAETLVETVRGVLEHQRVDEALSDHRQLKELVETIRRSIRTSETQERVIRTVYDHLGESSLFQFARVDTGSLNDIAAYGSGTVGSEQESLDSFRDDGTEDDSTNDESRAEVRVSEPGPGGLRTATVPLQDDAALRGVLTVSAARPHAFDESECDALADLGTIVGDALNRDADESSDETEVEPEVSRKQFARTVAHEVRNPLDVAKGYIELATEQEDVTYLERVRASIERIEHILERELAYVDQVDAEEVTVHELAEAATEAWNLVPTQDAELVIDDSEEILADRDLLVGLFANLFDNAVIHAGADATVRIGSSDVGFYVTDDGPGIEPSERDSVFEFGYTTGSGTGVGLAVVQRIVEAHGWEIAVVDGETGSRFELTGIETAVKEQ